MTWVSLIAVTVLTSNLLIWFLRRNRRIFSKIPPHPPKASRVSSFLIIQGVLESSSGSLLGNEFVFRSELLDDTPLTKRQAAKAPLDYSPGRAAMNLALNPPKYSHRPTPPPGLHA